MNFELFMYCTIGRRAELERGLAGLQNDLYQRFLAEIADYVRTADEQGYAGFGHPEHHLQIEGFEISNDPVAMALHLGAHSQRLKVMTVGWVSTTWNPLRAAEQIATVDHMLRGRFSVGLVRGYQARWVDNYKIRSELSAVGPWNKDTDVDDLNREHFAEWVDIVLTALREPTFSYQGKFWQFPPPGYVNPHPHGVYHEFGQGVDADMTVREVGIAPRPYQDPHPQIYGGFTASMRTALFWARHKGRPIVLSGNLEFCRNLWGRYREEAARHGHDVKPGEEAAWGGLMICAPTDAEAQEWAEDMRWFWDRWALPFGQGYPELLIGSPDTLTRRIEEAAATFPLEECMLLIPQGIHTPSQIHTSLELFSTQVMPRFQ
ncbi:MAG: LLM class flavin-dependent oxidoreductase [Acidimicrobiales bacterium]